MTTHPTRLRAVVTAGSTIGQIDAVRFVEQVGLDANLGPTERCGRLDRFEMQNPFKGALGMRIAEAMHRRGINVTLLTRADLLSAMKHELPSSAIESFRTFQDLERALPELLKRVKPDLVWQAAAVSDWIPTEVEGVSATEALGKIDSKADTLRVVFKKTPKLLDRIRAVVGKHATVVGFKLLVNVTDEQLAKKATEQLHRADIDFCVGNDNIKITSSCHPVTLYTRDGKLLRFSGTKAETAEWLVETVLRSHALKV